MVDVVSLAPQDGERYADIIADVGSALTRGDIVHAESALRPVAGEVWMGRMPLVGRKAAESTGGRSPRDVTDAIRAAVFHRDGFHCSYCGGRVVPRCILVAISDIFPEALPYHPNYRRGYIHPAYWALAPEADHTVAYSQGGPGALSNLATMHTACNARKSDSVLEELPLVDRIAAVDGWDGLVDSYAGIVDAGAAGSRHSSAGYHPRWLRSFAALENPAHSGDRTA